MITKVFVYDINASKFVFLNPVPSDTEKTMLAKLIDSKHKFDTLLNQERTEFNFNGVEHFTQRFTNALVGAGGISVNRNKRFLYKIFEKLNQQLDMFGIKHCDSDDFYQLVADEFSAFNARTPDVSPTILARNQSQNGSKSPVFLKKNPKNNIEIIEMASERSETPQPVEEVAKPAPPAPAPTLAIVVPKVDQVVAEKVAQRSEQVHHSEQHSQNGHVTQTLVTHHAQKIEQTLAADQAKNAETSHTVNITKVDHKTSEEHHAVRVEEHRHVEHTARIQQTNHVEKVQTFKSAEHAKFTENADLPDYVQKVITPKFEIAFEKKTEEVPQKSENEIRHEPTSEKFGISNVVVLQKVDVPEPKKKTTIKAGEVVLGTERNIDSMVASRRNPSERSPNDSQRPIVPPPLLHTSSRQHVKNDMVSEDAGPVEEVHARSFDNLMIDMDMIKPRIPNRDALFIAFTFFMITTILLAFYGDTINAILNGRADAL